MNREQFIEFVKEPGSLDAGSTALLENLVREYPFCQTAEILYALNLNKENNFRFNAQLKTAAAYATDRKLLKQLLSEQKSFLQHHEEPGTPGTGVKIQGPVEAADTEPVPEPHRQNEATQAYDKKAELISLIDRLKDEIESILTEDPDAENPTLAELASSLETIIYKKKEADTPPLRPDIKDYNFSHLPPLVEKPDDSLSNNDLIDKFIREEPRLEAPKKAEFFDAVDYAKHGLEDKGNIVSETLARIHVKQGRTEEAIKIYKRLSLLYPEKSSFFAAQIEKIKMGSTD